jgi:hypothetical protein
LNKISSCLLAIVLTTFALSGCDSDRSGSHSRRHERSQYEDEESSNSRNLSPSPIPPGAVEATDDHEIIQAQTSNLVNAEVTGRAVVKKLLRDDVVAPRHQKFLLELTNGTTILVAHNTDVAPQVPIQEGDQLVIHGSFIYNTKGGLIHWTHHSNSPRHQGGYIDFNGARYQ